MPREFYPQTEKLTRPQRFCETSEGERLMSFILSTVSCYYCSEATKEKCLENKYEKECKPGEVCLGLKGIAYILDCASQEYVQAAKEECETPWCRGIETCDQSKCLPDIFN